MTAHIYRPAYFSPSKKYPEDRLHQRSALFRVADNIMGPAFKTLTPSFYSPVEDLGRFAVEVAKGRWPQQTLFRNADMRELIKSVTPSAEAQAKRDEL